MALSVIPPPVSELADDRSAALVVVESDAPRGPHGFQAAMAELEPSIQLHNFALGWAAQAGVIPPRLNGNSLGPYPVNAEGVPLHKVAPEVPPDSPLRQPARYRIDVPVCRPPL